MNKLDVKEGDAYQLNCGSIATVVEYRNCRDVDIVTNYGFFDTVRFDELRSGVIKDYCKPCVQGIGYLGQGDRREGVGLWRDILKRCYSERITLKEKSYINAIVCDEWHNFQNFSKWYKNNYVKGYQLDKDLKNPGMKVYGPDCCLFLPKDVNSFIQIQDKKSDLPIGINMSTNDTVRVTMYGKKTKFFRYIKDASEYYWLEKYKKNEIYKKKYPHLSDYLTNHFIYRICYYED